MPDHRLYFFDTAGFARSGGTAEDIFPDSDTTVGLSSGQTIRWSRVPTRQILNLTDSNDALLDDDGGTTQQVEASSIVLGEQGGAGGALNVQWHYTLQDAAGNQVQVYGVHWDGAADNPAAASNTQGVVLSAPLTPDTTYTIVGTPTANAASVAYADLLSPPPLDGIIQGTGARDAITASSTPDPQGDQIDHNDAVLGNAGSNDDIVQGLGGNDVIWSEAGDDTVFGGESNDNINSGDGNDLVYGHGDTLGGDPAEPGNDTIRSGSGDDTVYAGAGQDYVHGGPGQDLIHGQDGDDNLRGGHGNDTMYGGEGNDLMLGLTHDDLLYGEGGNDTLQGNSGNDTIFGGDGDDSITGDYGEDSIEGGDGADTINAGASDDIVRGGAGDDSITGAVGDDTLFGDDGNDVIEGAGGHDQIVGGAGSDTLRGDDATDTVAGNDTLSGGDDDDAIYGDIGDDSLSGDGGNDMLQADQGSDTMVGGEGFDTFSVADAGSHGIADFNTATGQNFDDGDQSNNDFIDLSGYYSALNLIAVNQEREANGQEPYPHPLAWLRADQADGVLNDPDDLDLVIANASAAVAAEDLTFDNTNVMCFAADTLIETDQGPRRIATLRAGDRVVTRDNGLQAIRWIGQRHLPAAALQAQPNLRPVRIAAGALGNGLPLRDLVVSPQHRILLRSRIAQRMFDTSEVLVAAKQLCEIKGIDQIQPGGNGVTYVHILFTRHEIVIAEGAETESLYTGKQALASVSAAARAEIFAIFPELRSRNEDGETTVPARLLISGSQGRQLAHRHAKNRRQLLS